MKMACPISFSAPDVVQYHNDPVCAGLTRRITNMPKTLLCVSFGTSVSEARESITAVEDALRRVAPELPFTRAFTSPTIRRILQSRGETVPSLPQALEALKGEEVVVQPTHFLYGQEYDCIRRQVEEQRENFAALTLGKPLLAGVQDLRDLAEAIHAACPPIPGEALLLMGHGTEHFAGVVYPALQTVFHMMGRTDVFIATAEGWPELEDILPQMKAAGCTCAHLMPLMLVAGDHACNDMAGDDPESWKSRLNKEGIPVRCTLRGLGTLPAVQALYAAHLRQLLEQKP